MTTYKFKNRGKVEKMYQVKSWKKELMSMICTVIELSVLGHFDK